MPVCLHRGPSGHELSKPTNGFRGQSRAVEFHESDASCIDIGLLNNMPDAALQSTERQFLTMIDRASEGIVVRVSLYALSDIPRTDSGRRHVSNRYRGIESLWDSHLDGLIITGTEPRAPGLTDEPYWDSLIKVLDWAEQSTRSTVFSCLSAHAAVLHFDGIERQRLTHKRFGLFESTLASDHQLTACTPPRFRMPHSRWNGVPENHLTACGYRVLARSEDAHVDLFVKEKRSLLVFFQGHPEYETNTLLLEYRRDVGRYIRHETDTYPRIPQSYFDEETASILRTMQERVLYDRRDALLAAFPTACLESRLVNTWSVAAAGICGNWLKYLSAQKDRRSSQFCLSTLA